MAECLRCNLCECPGTFSDGEDVHRVPCNVRQFQDNVFTLWRCRGCGSLHCLEDADLPVYYAQYPLKKQRFTFSERIGYGNRLKLMRRQGIRRTSRILDYGCGAGLYVNFLRQKGYTNVFGYDPFVPQYADPKTLHSTYDAVVSYDVIEHEEDPAGFLRAIRRPVRHGGLVIVGTPNADHISPALRGDPNLHVPYHRHILSEKILLELTRKQGMEPVHIYRRSFYDSPIPTVNSNFMWRYLRKTGGLLDAAVEPPDIALVLRSPEMLLTAFSGYFLPAHDYILGTFRIVSDAVPEDRSLAQAVAAGMGGRDIDAR
jgi:2-polyprenyl-3-methyl-5-hydroxy-6-metoxy-1,4-benzoquinol methylase